MSTATGRFHWRDLQSDAEAEVWQGLELRVAPDGPGCPRPGLHIQAGAPQLMRLMAGESPILWARVESDYYGYWYLQRPLATSSRGLVVAPLTAAEARSVEAPAGSGEWLRAWARLFGRK